MWQLIFFFSLQQNMDNNILLYSAPPKKKRKRQKDKKEEKKWWMKLWLHWFFNVVLNIEIIFVTYWRQCYIIIMYRTVKIRKRLFLARKNWQENEYVINIIWKKNHTYVKMWWELGTCSYRMKQKSLPHSVVWLLQSVTKFHYHLLA